MPRVKLGDVAREYKSVVKNTSGFPVVGLEHLTPCEIALSNWDEDVETTFTKGFKKGHVLFGRRRAYLKKAAVAPFDGVCSGDIIVIEAIEGKIKSELLPYIIQNDLLFDFAMSRSAGGLSPRVKWTDLKEFEFDLPDIIEQDGLSDLLSTAYETKQAYQKLLRQTDELVKSQFIEMFGNEENVVPLSECGRIVTGGTPPKKKAEYYATKDIHFYKPNDCSDGSVTYLTESEEYISETARSVADIFDKGTILVTCIGTIGKIGILTGEGTCNQQINAIIPTAAKCVSEYIATALWVKRKELESIANATTVTIINKSSFSAFRIPLPEIDAQKRFVEFVQQSDKSKFEIQQSIVKIDNLMRSLIQGTNS